MSFQPLNSRVGNDFPLSQAETERVRVLTQEPASESPRRILLVSFLIIAIVCVGAMTLSAQENGGNAAGKYDVIPFAPAFIDQQTKNVNESRVKRVIGLAKSYSSGGTISANDMGSVGAFFNLYLPAKMTEPSATKSMTSLMRTVNDCLVRTQRGRSAQVRKVVGDALLNQMNKIAAGNYHPSARINAALILGKLESVPADLSQRTLPKPYPGVFGPLVNLYRDENNPDGLRAAALLGIHRQVAYGQRQGADQVKDMMTKLLDSDAPANRNDKVHAYLQRYAVDILQQLGSSVDDDKALGKKLISISTTPEKQKLIAPHSASKIGALGKNLKDEVAQPEDVLQGWARLAHDAFQSEVDRLNALERKKPTPNQPINPSDVLRPKVSEDASGDSRFGSGGPGLEDDGEGGMEMGGMEGMDAGSGPGYGDDPGEGMEDDLFGGGMDDMFGGGAATKQYKDQPAEVIGSRRYLNKVLQQISLGATGSRSKGLPKADGGLMLCVAADKSEVVKTWVEQMAEVITALNKEELDDREKYLEGVEEQVIVLAEMADIDSTPEAKKPKDTKKPVDDDLFSDQANPAAGAAAPANPAAGAAAPANPAAGAAAPANPAAGGSAAPADPAAGGAAPVAPAAGGGAAPASPAPADPAS